MKKIFGIGLPKTGTLSLHHALKELGIKSTHYPISNVIPAFHNARYDTLTDFEAYVNCGEWHFAALNRVYPDSKFIYTWREIDEWLISIKNHIERYPLPSKTENPYFNRLEIFGIINFDEDIMTTIYYAHKYIVNKYFENKNNFLSINLKENNAMEKLCSFLDLPVSNAIFPHKNKSQ